jgi:hypothetical protein
MILHLVVLLCWGGCDDRGLTGAATAAGGCTWVCYGLPGGRREARQGVACATSSARFAYRACTYMSWKTRAAPNELLLLCVCVFGACPLLCAWYGSRMWGAGDDVPWVRRRELFSLHGVCCAWGQGEVCAAPVSSGGGGVTCGVKGWVVRPLIAFS